ncbi:asparagine synthetase domain-containing protein 1-like isoform X2 [Halichondria panicea]|uniref:asparagine synthetase domain-containing protein 1-like isoform X2 n=1 Tax=Halichondria panicea TaxID=6063 RepID=UPI00312B5206
MCGIFACLFCEGGINAQLKEEILWKLKRRGPDAIKEVTLKVGGPSLHLNLIGSLLRMRGDPTPQPHQVEVTSATGTHHTNHLLWNGNIFGGGIKIPRGCNDTVILGQELAAQEGTVAGLLATLSSICGPWALVYWQESTQSLWFGRDVFGRRSLLWHTPSKDDDLFALCSVGHYSEQDMPLGYWMEIPANGIYQLKCRGPLERGDELFQTESIIQDDFSALNTTLSTSVSLVKCLQVPFPPLNKHTPTTNPTECCKTEIADGDNVSKATTVETPILPLCDVSPPVTVHTYPLSALDWSVLSQQLLDVLQAAVQVRVDHAPEVPSNTSGPSTDHSITVSSAKEQSELSSGSATVVDCKDNEAPSSCGVQSLDSKHFTKDELKVQGESFTSLDEVRRKESGKHNSPEDSLQDKAAHFEVRVERSVVREGRAKVAVLYSGGVDSTVLAALADRCLPKGEEIDLINVAFEQKSATVEKRFDVPDRVSAFESLRELNPERAWNLVMVNGTLEEVNEMRRTQISHMVYPLCTVLDDSIGCALWFAARGVGLLHSDHHPPAPYHSQARTLLVGIGADEQLAGYARHRTKFNSSGWPGLTAELEMEVKRLARRNLGRDDRCVADHEREGQFPFLDEHVVTFLQTLPSCCKADLSLPRGQGEKRLLREVAHLLGCHGAGRLPKRAIQFGSRMAKMSGTSNNREQGSSVTGRLLPGTH